MQPVDPSAASADAPPVERIPLAPIPTPPAPEVPLTPPPALGLLDGLLVVLLLGFAFCLAAFRASNSDVYLHLAVGRLVAQGAYPFGEDPFTFTATGWINNSWLYSLGLYLLHDVSNGSALVAVKAAAIAVLALLLALAGRRPGDRLWIGVMSAGLAVLVMSPRLLLTPLIASLLLLALLVWLLLRHREGGRAIYLIPAICFVWVNLDGWFFLGPFAVLLYLIGDGIEGGKQTRTLGVVLAASLLLCCLNPYHVKVFTTLPPELLRFGPAAELANDPLIRGWHLSLFEREYYDPAIGLSVAGLSVFVLLALGVGSFLFVFPAVDLRRATVFVGFLLLGLVGYRLIPLFAVVAAPILALNFLEGAERRWGSEAYCLPGWRLWATSGRLLSAILLGVGIALSIPGWLQATPHFNRRFDLSLDVDEGLKAVALRIDALRQQGALSAGQRWLNLGVEPVAYFAWFCPGEKLFIDHRIGIYPREVIQDYVTLRKALQGEASSSREPGKEPPPPAWRAILAQREIGSVVVHALNLERQFPTLQRLFAGESEWTLCALGGRSSAHAWREPGQPLRLDARAIYPTRELAFGPEAQVIPMGDTPPLTFLDALTNEPRPPTAASYAAQQHLLRFEVLGDRMREENDRLFLALAAARQATFWAVPAAQASTLLGVGSTFPLDQFFTFTQVRPNWLNSLDNGPPECAYLAVRSAREAIRLNAQDYRAYWTLARAVRVLHYQTRERSRVQNLLPHVSILRQSQILWAYREALRLEPPPLVRQQILIGMMEALDFDGTRNYFDEQVEHQAEVVRLANERRVFLLASPENAEKALKEYEKQLRANELERKKRRDDFVVQTSRMPPVQKAIEAVRRGLSQDALRVLNNAKPEELSANRGAGMVMLLSLQMALGYAEQVRQRLTPTEGVKFDPAAFGDHPLGLPAYEWFRIQLAATLGEYDLAEQALADLEAGRLADGYRGTATGLSDALLSAARQSFFPPQILSPAPLQWGPKVGTVVETSVQLREQSSILATLRAWLLLEAGRISQAQEQVERAFQATELGFTPDGKNRQFLTLRSVPLATLIRQKIQR